MRQAVKRAAGWWKDCRYVPDEDPHRHKVFAVITIPWGALSMGLMARMLIFAGMVLRSVRRLMGTSLPPYSARPPFSDSGRLCPNCASECWIDQ